MAKPPGRDFLVDKNTAWLTRRRDGLLNRLRRIGPFLNGSLVLMARTCGNVAHCHCRTGPKHVSTYMTYKDRGKSGTLYVPVDLEQDVRRWSSDYRRLKGLIQQISEIQRRIVRQHVQERRRHR